MPKKENSNDKGSKKRTRADILTEIKQLQEQLPKEIALPITFVTETTTEGARDLLVEQSGRIAIQAAEGGTQFEILGGLYSKGANLDLFLNGHPGDEVRVKRAEKIHLIPRPAVTLGICVQPDVISSFSEGTKRAFRGRGLTARFAFVHPASNVGYRDVRNRPPIPQTVQTAYDDGIKRLAELGYKINQSIESEPKVLVLSDEAREHWLQFFDWLEHEQRPGGSLFQISDWAGKAHGLALRLAGLIHMARCLDAPILTVSAEDIATACDIVELLAAHTKSALGLIGADGTIIDAQFCLDWIKSHAIHDANKAYYFKRSDLLTTSRFKKSPVDRLKKALENLRERNIISGVKRLPTKKPTLIHYVNPTLMEG